MGARGGGPLEPLGRQARAAAFAAGPPKLSSKVVLVTLAVLVGLTLAGTLVDRLFSSLGLNAAAGTATKSEPVRGVQPLGSGLVDPPGGKSLAAFLGTEMLARNPAPPVDLVDQSGTALSIAALRGRVVVLSFFDSACDDICPVLGAELAAADRALGARSRAVAFVTVNSDPRSTARSPAPAALSATGLDALRNVYFLTGSLGALDRTWSAYSISIDVGANGQVAHNDLVYLIDPKGRLAYRMTPYGDESKSGVYHLAPALERRFAAGIATYAEALAGGTGARRH